MKYKYFDIDILQKLNKFSFEFNNIIEGKYSGRHKSLFIGKSLNFAQHREYIFGDDIKDIDWKIYARRDRFFVKQYYRETNLISWFFLDSSKSMWFPEDGIKKYEYGSFLISYLSYVILNQGNFVGIAKFSERIREILQPSSKRDFYYSILEFLEKEYVNGITVFENVINEIPYIVKKKSLLFFISDLIHKDIKNLVYMLRQLSKYGIYIYILHIIAEKEKKLLYDFNNLLFEDIENVLHGVKVNLDEIKDIYEKKFCELIEYFKKELNDSNIKYFLIDTSKPILENLNLVLTRK